MKKEWILGHTLKVNKINRLKRKAFTLLEILLVLFCLAILSTLAIPKITAYHQSACTKKLQIALMNFKITLQHQNQALELYQTPLDWDKLYANLDFNTKDCHFQKQKEGFIAINGEYQAYFVLKNGVMECQYQKSSRLHKGESYCDIF